MHVLELYFYGSGNLLLPNMLSVFTLDDWVSPIAHTNTLETIEGRGTEYVMSADQLGLTNHTGGICPRPLEPCSE